MTEILVALAIALGASSDTEVRCLPGPIFQQEAVAFELEGAYAMAHVGGPTIWLRNRTCKRVAFPTRYRKMDASFELLVFAHEVAHNRGEADEHAATCQGWKQVKRLAKLRGDKRAYKLRRLARWHARHSVADSHTCRR